jgi:hypothetical protein
LQKQEDNSRQAQLRVAAEALVEWMHARRATWSSDGVGMAEFSGLDDFSDGEPLSPSPPFGAPPVFTARPSAFDAPPVFAAWPPAPDDSVTFDVTAILDAEPPVAKPKKPRVQLQFPTDAVRSVAAPLIRVARRAAPAAAVLALVVGAGWLARPYVGNVKTWVTSLTEKKPPPKPAPVAVAVAAKPTPSAGARRTGILMARSEPPGAIVLVDGRERGVTPLTLNDLTAGAHTVVLQSDKGSVRRTVTVAADRTALVSESIFAGWLSVFSPFEVQISEGALAIRLDETSKVLLSPGPHDLRFENRDLGFRETRRVEVQPGQTTSLSIVASPSTLTVTANAPAVVTIDGQQVGETPLRSHPIALGTREIVVKSADGTERRITQKVTVAPVQIDVDFTQQ